MSKFYDIILYNPYTDIALAGLITVIYEGNDIHTGELMTFVRTKEDFEKDFEPC